METVKVSPNAFGNGDKKKKSKDTHRWSHVKPTEMTRAKDVVWCDMDSHEVVDVVDSGGGGLLNGEERGESGRFCFARNAADAEERRSAPTGVADDVFR